jgi:hypothetical protein
MFSSNLTVSPAWSLVKTNPRKAGLALFAGILLVHRFVTVTYRLLFSPIAKFPGPKLAAASGLYELYFNFCKNGKYVFEIERLHRIYGMSMPLSCCKKLMSDKGRLYASTLTNSQSRTQISTTRYIYPAAFAKPTTITILLTASISKA